MQKGTDHVFGEILIFSHRILLNLYIGTCFDLLFCVDSNIIFSLAFLENEVKNSKKKKKSQNDILHVKTSLYLKE